MTTGPCIPATPKRKRRLRCAPDVRAREAKARMRLAAALFAAVVAAGCGESPSSTTGADAGTVPVADAGTVPVMDPGPAYLQVTGWSTKKRLRNAAGQDVLLEEQLTSFSVLTGPTRVRRIDGTSAAQPVWVAPAGLYIEDVSLHPSGAVSAVLVDGTFAVWLARLSPDLGQLDLAQLHDQAIASDPGIPPGGPAPTDLQANPLSRDSARIACDGEEAVVLVTVGSGLESMIVYRLAFAASWAAPRRTLVQSASPHLPFLPIGGSFDTFGAMWSSYRALLDVDEDGDALVAFWANGRKLAAHSTLFGLSLSPLPGDPTAPGTVDSDVLLAKFDREGRHLWSRVVGTSHEDEPYALRAAHESVVVVGRSRRFPGFDNTFWDALVSVTGADGTPVASRAVELSDSSILLGVDVLPDGGLVAGGSEGWAQNPDGLSVLSFGTKLLVQLTPTLEGDPVRLALPAGPRHNEIHTVQSDASHLWFAGHEDGPVMHTGDADQSQIHATGVAGFLAR
jgi:hypothetical protein